MRADPPTSVEPYRGGAAEWDAFVRRTPGAVFFHRYGWRDVLVDSFGFGDRYLVARRGGAIVGVLPLCEVRSPLRRARLLSLPFTVEGGVCAADADARRALERAAMALCAPRAASLELRDGLDGDGFSIRSGTYCRFRRRLFDSDAENLAAMHRKQRRMIRVGQEHGLTARVDAADLDVFYDLFSRSMRRLGTPVLPRGYFRRLIDAFGDDCAILTVRHGDTPVASVFSFFFADTVLPYYAGSRREYFSHAVNDALYWELMRYARGRGARWFDFGRSKRGSGAFAFKRHWGFEPEPLRYRVYPAERPDAAAAPLDSGARWLRSLWPRMPLALTRVVGPTLMRHLGVYHT